MKSARYRFVKQIGGRGFFAEVAVECVDVTDGPVIEVAPSANEGNCTDWRSAAERGVRYALHHASPPLELSQLHITVTSIVELVVDTCESAVMAAAAYATWKALGLEGSPPPRFEGRTIVFAS
jgi:hypothetical protein